MHVDYKLYADNDPGGDLTQAFRAMSLETVATTPIMRLNYIKVADKVDFGTAVNLGEAIEQAIVDKLVPSWIRTAMESSGLDINNQQVQSTLSAMVNKGITEKQKDLIIAVGKVEVPKYPGLKEGYLQNARQMRIKGTI